MSYSSANALNEFIKTATTLGGNNVVTPVTNGAVPNVQEKSKFLLKVGVETEVYFPSTDTREKAFISVPQPLYLDTMRQNTVSGEGDFQCLLANGNKLLGSLLKKAESLKPGEEYVTNLKVVLYRRKEANAQETSETFDDLI